MIIELKQKLWMTVVVALIADGPVTTLDPVRKVAPHIRRIKQVVQLTHEVLALARLTVPVLAAVVGIRVPAVPQPRAVQRMVAVRWRGGLELAVLVAVVADRPLAAIHPVGRIAPDMVRVEQHVVLAGVVLALAVRAVPVLATVVGVGVPAVGHVAAVHHVAAIRGRRGGGGRLLAVLVTVVTDGPVAAVHPVGIVTLHIDVVEEQVVSTDEVVAGAVETVPVLAAVEGVRVPAARHVGAVHHMAAVRRRRRVGLGSGPAGSCGHQKNGGNKTGNHSPVWVKSTLDYRATRASSGPQR